MDHKRRYFVFGYFYLKEGFYTNMCSFFNALCNDVIGFQSLDIIISCW